MFNNFNLFGNSIFLRGLVNNNRLQSVSTESSESIAKKIFMKVNSIIDYLFYHDSIQTDLEIQNLINNLVETIKGQRINIVNDLKISLLNTISRYFSNRTIDKREIEIITCIRVIFLYFFIVKKSFSDTDVEIELIKEAIFILSQDVVVILTKNYNNILTNLIVTLSLLRP